MDYKKEGITKSKKQNLKYLNYSKNVEPFPNLKIKSLKKGK